MKSNSRWKNHDLWLCLNHLPAVRYRAGQDDCWYAGCKTKRPDEAGRPEKTEEAPPPPPRPRPRARPRRPVVRPAVAPAPTVVAEAPAAAPVAPKVTTPAPSSTKATSSDGEGDDVTEAEVDFDPEEKCAWPPCTKKKRPRSKYCSRNCSNKFARWRHRQRQKAKDE